MISSPNETGAQLILFLAGKLIGLTKGNIAATGMVILWNAAILSAIVNNIPFVTTE